MSELAAGHPSEEPSSPRWLGLLGWVVVCFGASAIGARFMPGAWYAALERPSFAPPNWIFAPVWTVLYAMMAISAWLIWRPQGFRGSARLPLILFLVQLAMNSAWSWLFFGKHRMDWALIDIMALFVLLVGLISTFHRQNQWAAWLLVPYAAWLAFATLLNTAFWQLNH